MSRTVAATVTNHLATLTWILKALVILFMLNKLGDSSKIGGAPPAAGCVNLNQPINKPVKKPIVNPLIVNLQWGVTYVFRREFLPDRLISHIETHGYRFTTHGLWERKPNRYYCNDFANLTLGILIRFGRMFPQLHVHWPAFDLDPFPYQPPSEHLNELFWLHEWKKHGTCITSLGVEHLDEPMHYFLKAVEVTRRIDVRFNVPWNRNDEGEFHAIDENGETFFQRYTGLSFRLNEFKTNADNVLGFKINVRCHTFPWAEGYAFNRSLIESIDVCLDWNLNFQNCVQSSSTCEEWVELPILGNDEINIFRHFYARPVPHERRPINVRR